MVSPQPAVAVSYADRAKQGRLNPNPSKPPSSSSTTTTTAMDESNVSGDVRKPQSLLNGVTHNGESSKVNNAWTARKDQPINTARPSSDTQLSAPSSSSNHPTSSSKSSKKKHKSRNPTPNKSSQPSPAPPAPPSFADESTWPEPAQTITVTTDKESHTLADKDKDVPPTDGNHSREGSTTGSKKKEKWIAMPPAELQAAMDASNPRGRRQDNGGRRHGGGSKRSSNAGSPAKGYNSLHTHPNSTARSSYNSSPRAPSFTPFPSGPSRSPLILEAQFGQSRPQSQFSSPQRVTVPVHSPYPQHPIPNHHHHPPLTPSYLSIQQPLPAQPPRRRVHRPSPSQSSPVGGDIPPTPQRNEYAFKPVFGSITPSGDLTSSSSPANPGGLGLAVDGGAQERNYGQRSQTEAEKIMKRDGKFGIGIDNKVNTSDAAVNELQSNMNELKLDAGVEVNGEISMVVSGEGYPSQSGVADQQRAPNPLKKWSFGTLDEGGSTPPYTTGMSGESYPPSSSVSSAGGYNNTRQHGYYNGGYYEGGYSYGRGGYGGGRRYADQDDYRSSRRSSPGDGQRGYYGNGSGSGGYRGGDGHRRGGRGRGGYSRGYNRGMNGSGYRGGHHHHQDQHHHIPPPMQPQVMSPYGPPPGMPMQPYPYPPHAYGIYDPAATMPPMPAPVEYQDPYGVPPQLPPQTTGGGSGNGGSPTTSQMPPQVDPSQYPPTPQMVSNPYAPYGMYPPPVQQPPYMPYMYGQPVAYGPPLPMPPVVGQQQQQINGVAPGGGFGAPIPMPLTYPGYQLDPLRLYLLGQIEYYFSIQNLAKDVFLRNQMDTEGWIDIATIASFNRVRQLTTDLNVVKETMALSQLVEVDEERTKVRVANRGWESFVLHSTSSPNGAAVDYGVGGGAVESESTTTATTTATGESGRSPSSTVDGGNEVDVAGLKLGFQVAEDTVSEVPVIS
ncbi:hypothetical protein FRC03_000562 [Tulasnella sp. 419]|nr:hypothetical protein FRC03_000562 [Tulasnella sp. 419]